MPRTKLVQRYVMSAGTIPASYRFTPYRDGPTVTTLGRKRKPQRNKDYYSVSDIEDYLYDELRTIVRQSELAEVFEEGDLGYAKWTGVGDFRPGCYLFKLV